MAASKRKRGGEGSFQLKAKKGKIVVDDSKTQENAEQEKKNEVIVPAPVSMVSAGACYLSYVS